MKYRFSKKSRFKRLMTFGLIIGMLLSLAACGKEAKDTRPKAKSIFEFFDSEPDTDDPWSTESTQQPSTGDIEVDPPVIDPPNVAPPAADPNQYSDTESEELNRLFDELFKENVASSSITYRNYVKDGNNFGGIKPPNPPTIGESDYSEEGFAEDKKKTEEWIAKLEALDVNTFTEQQRFDYDYVLDSLKSSLIAFENVYIGGDFAPMRGFQGNFPSEFTDWIFESKEDIQLCIDVAKLYPPEVDKALEFEALRVEKGYGYEDCVIDKIIEQCDEFLNQTGENFLITVFNEQVDEYPGLSDQERADFKKQFSDVITNEIVPLYQRIKSAFQGFKGKAKVTGGMCNYEDHGSEIYAYLVREYTGSTKTPEEMIRYLEQKMSDTKTKMSTIYIMHSDAYNYYVQNEGKLFDYMSSWTATEVEDYLIEHALADYPKLDKIPYRILYFDKSMEKMRENTVAYYMIPPIDDYTDNLIRVNGAHKEDMWNTLAHEGCPGHMYQTNYYRSTKPNPVRCMGLELGYVEGWAVYASYESMKYCDFNGSPYADVLAELSTLEASYSYMLYGRIDLGINAEGWTVEDVSNYLSNAGMNSGAAQELYTVLSGDPAVYLSYSVGYLEMQDMRDYAEAELGDKFDVVAYHKAVLDAGPCKYDLLKRRVDKYILETK